jgi:isoprenylcysteine carboxyl methyltransferase (ICMT) family protein YpbQ
MLARMPEYAVNIVITLLIALLAGVAVGTVCAFPRNHAALHARASAPQVGSPWGMIP